MSRLARLALHPFLFAGFHVLSVQVDTGVHLQSTLRVWAVALLAALVALIIGFALNRRWLVAGLAASAAVWLLASQNLDRLWLTVVAVLAAAGALLLAWRLTRGRIGVADANAGLNVMSLVLLGSTVLTGIGNGVLPASVGDFMDRPSPVDSRPPAEGMPDIYLVILDGYPRADVLDQVSGMDNAPFLSELEARGFSVASDSRSSYMYSDLLVTALFHGRHLVDIPELQPLRDGATKPALGREVLNQAPLVERLRERGYVTIANAQAWDEPSLRNVDVYLEGSGFNEFERHMWWSSLPGSLMELRGPVVFQDGIEPWVHDGFSAFEAAAGLELDRPRFAFIHVPSPHFPIIFEADGSRAEARFGLDHPNQVRASREELRAAYAGQVEYLNRRLLETIDTADLPEDAVVILMGDHGPEFGLNWADGTESDLSVRFAAFFAARVPEGTYAEDTNVAEALLELLRARDLVDLPPMPDRYFVTNATEKLATIVEVPDPWPN